MSDFVNTNRLMTQSNLVQSESCTSQGSLCEYFEVREKLLSSSVVTKNNILLKTLDLRNSSRIEEKYKSLIQNSFNFSNGPDDDDSEDWSEDDYDYEDRDRWNGDTFHDHDYGWMERLGREEEESMDRETGGAWRWNVD